MSKSEIAYPLPEQAIAIANLIRSNSNFLVIGHLRPDGDCLGSCLGLLLILKALDKSARFYTAGPLPDFLGYLPHFNDIETDFPKDTFDTVLCVDIADANRVYRGYEPTDNVAVIDHHISNTLYGQLNWIDAKASAAAEMIYMLADELEVEITPDIATCLYTGIMTDTGSFRYSNTTTQTFRIVSDLVALGAKPDKIAEEVWESRSPVAVKVGALILSTIHYEFDGRFAWNELTQEMLKSAGGSESDSEGLSSEMRTIQGVEIAVLFYETPDGQCRIGFRSRGDLNVSNLAGLLGGGGHRNASGASLSENYPAAKDRALTIMREFLTEHFGKA